MLAFICWCILFIIIFALLCSLMPWWLVLLIFAILFIIEFLPEYYRTRQIDRENKAYSERRRKQELSNKKKSRNKVNTAKKVKTNNAEIGAGTVLAGAALAHQMRKHHKHDDTKNTIRNIREDDFDDVYDDFDDVYDDFYDYNDIQDYDDIDYENYIAEQIEEQAAYDDYIASIDMADD